MSIRILIIEDNPDHLLFAKRILDRDKEDYFVDIASTGEEGLKKIEKTEYDVILCDYRLPDYTAVDILERSKKISEDLAFIIITSAGSEKIAVELMQKGAYDYIVKDASYDETLLRVILRTRDRYKAKKEKKILEQQLLNSNKKLKEMFKIKSEFTSMVSHELRTPLAAIKESIAIVLDGSAGSINAQQKEFLVMGKLNVDRLKRLIDDVLDFSKLEDKRLIFRMEDNNINKLIQQIVDMQKQVAKEKGLYLKEELASELSSVCYDSDRISQVLNNLINNSIKFTKKGGVTIRSLKGNDKDHVRIVVEDTGEGIKKEDILKLFEKFQQLEGVNNRKVGGTGLGLAISKQIIEKHKGKIWIESEYGKYCRFIFELPVKPRFKILVIDDEKIVLDTCERILKTQDYDILRSSKGIEGINICKESNPDLIVLDVRLKDLSGYEIVERLKNFEATSAIPILIMSGYKDEIEKIKDEQDNVALPWIAKPFAAKALIEKVELLLA